PASASTPAMVRTMAGNLIRPARNAAAASSVAALYTAVIQPPSRPACRARSTAGKTAESNGSNSQLPATLKSQAAATRGARSGQPSASAIGSFMSGGLACAIVDPSVNVTIECTIDGGCTTT